MSTLEFPIKFENPTFSLLGIVLGASVISLLYLSHKRLRIAQKRLELVEWKKLRRIVGALNIGTKMCVVLALSFMLARPYFPTTIEVPVDAASEEQLAQYTVTAMLLMDASYSMNYSDLKPSRFEVSKTMGRLLINKMTSKDLLGFMSFAGRIYDTEFPTVNRTRITTKIDNQTLHQSTAIGTALETAIGVLDTYPAGGKAVVLFSDGKNNLGIDITSAVDAAVSLKIPVSTVSFGTYSMGEADPIALRDIASQTGGKFFEVRNEEIENLATSISQISHEVKVTALKAVYDRLTIPAKDYQTPTVVFSVLLVATLFLMWFTGV